MLKYIKLLTLLQLWGYNSQFYNTYLLFANQLLNNTKNYNKISIELVKKFSC